MHLDAGVVAGIIGGAFLVVGALIVLFLYGRGELARNIAEMQENAVSANAEIRESLTTELSLRDREIERLQAKNKTLTAQVDALQLVVAQGTKVEDLIGTVDTLRRDVLARLPIPGG